MGIEAMIYTVAVQRHGQDPADGPYYAEDYPQTGNIEVSRHVRAVFLTWAGADKVARQLLLGYGDGNGVTVDRGYTFEPVAVPLRAWWGGLPEHRRTCAVREKVLADLRHHRPELQAGELDAIRATLPVAN